MKPTSSINLSIGLKISMLIISMILVSIAILSFRTNTIKSNQVQIQQIDGIELYIACEPNDSTFIVLGNVKASAIVASDKPEAMAKHMVKKVKKDYPEATGVILYLNEDLQKGKAIKSK